MVAPAAIMAGMNPSLKLRTRVPLRARVNDRNTMSAILAISEGCMLIGPSESHRFAPLTSRPMNKTRMSRSSDPIMACAAKRRRVR